MFDFEMSMYFAKRRPTRLILILFLLIPAVFVAFYTCAKESRFESVETGGQASEAPSGADNFRETQVQVEAPTSECIEAAAPEHGIKMRFRKIEPGAFTMGSPSPSPLGSLFHSLGMLSDQEVGANQSPKTEVRITSSYYFARRTVTVEEYAMFLNDRTTSEDRAPAAIARDYLADPGVPWAKPHIVVNEQGLFGPAPGSGGGGCIFLSATFDGARAFAEWFGQEADLPRGLRAALPTEAEWAFAARGENSRVYPWGNTPPPQVGLDRYIVVLSPAGSSLKAYHCVKPLQSPDGATPCGIHDLIGPCEWTSDYYAERLPGGSVVDPVGPRRPAAERSATGSTMRVVRGCGDADFKAAGRSARFEDRGARIRLVLRRR